MDQHQYLLSVHGTVWETSGCKGVGDKDILETVIAVSGAPGGATMSCYQLLLAERAVPTPVEMLTHPTALWRKCQKAYSNDNITGLPRSRTR